MPVVTKVYGQIGDKYSDLVVSPSLPPLLNTIGMTAADVPFQVINNKYQWEVHRVLLCNASPVLDQMAGSSPMASDFRHKSVDVPYSLVSK